MLQQLSIYKISEGRFDEFLSIWLAGVYATCQAYSWHVQAGRLMGAVAGAVLLALLAFPISLLPAYIVLPVLIPLLVVGFSFWSRRKALPRLTLKEALAAMLGWAGLLFLMYAEVIRRQLGRARGDLDVWYRLGIGCEYY